MGQLDAVFRRFQQARSTVLAGADAANTQAALRRLLPHPARCAAPRTLFLLGSCWKMHCQHVIPRCLYGLNTDNHIGLCVLHRTRYTAITLLPQPSLWQRTVLAVAEWRAPSARTTAVLASAAVLASVATFAVVRAWRKGARPT